MTAGSTVGTGSWVRTTSSCAFGIELGDRHVDLRAGLVFEAALADIGDDADYARFAAADAVGGPSDGILSGPFAAGRGFVDDDGVFGVRLVAPGEVASFLQAHPHGFQVSGRDHVDKRSVVLTLVAAVFLGDQAPTAVAVKGEHVGHAGGLDAGQGADALQDFLEDGTTARDVIAIVEFDLEGGDVGGLEAEIDIEQADEAAREEAGADEQDARQRDFGDDEGGAEALVPSAVGHTGAAILEDVLEVAARDLECRADTEDYANRDGDRGCPRERGAIHTDCGKERQRHLILTGEVEGDGPGEDHAERCARAGEQETLGEHLSHETAAPGAQRGAHNELLPARRVRASIRFDTLMQTISRMSPTAPQRTKRERRSLPLTRSCRPERGRFIIVPPFTVRRAELGEDDVGFGLAPARRRHRV
jgi:hypothetical protein